MTLSERLATARGAVAPGRRADLVVFLDLQHPRPELVYKDGKLVARDGRALWPRGERNAAVSPTPPRIRMPDSKADRIPVFISPDRALDPARDGNDEFVVFIYFS